MERVHHVLAHANRPLPLTELRHACRLRTARVCEALAALTAQGRVQKTVAGYQLASGDAADSFPSAPLHEAGNGNGNDSDAAPTIAHGSGPE
jgi:phage terminase large subunit-like protein